MGAVAGLLPVAALGTFAYRVVRARWVNRPRDFARPSVLLHWGLLGATWAAILAHA